MKKVINSTSIAIMIIIIAIGWYNAQTNEKFGEISIGQVLTLFIAVGIAFWANQRKIDERKVKEQIEKLIERTQAIVLSQNFYSFKISQ